MLIKVTAHINIYFAKAGPSRQVSQEAAEAKRAAADAALARLRAPAPCYAKGGSTAIQIRMRKELEAERKALKVNKICNKKSLYNNTCVVFLCGVKCNTILVNIYHCVEQWSANF